MPDDLAPSEDFHNEPDFRPTLGEVYRLCLTIRREVAAVKNEDRDISKRVTALEDDALRIKTIWLALTLIFAFFSDWIRHKVGLS